jgi:hypothetical protein
MIDDWFSTYFAGEKMVELKQESAAKLETVTTIATNIVESSTIMYHGVLIDVHSIPSTWYSRSVDVTLSINSLLD